MGHDVGKVVIGDKGKLWLGRECCEVAGDEVKAPGTELWGIVQLCCQQECCMGGINKGTL